MDMMSCKEAALRWGVSDRWVTGLCKTGHISGAIKTGKIWQIPADTPKPEDKRRKNGKYSKHKTIPKLPLPIGISDFIKAQESYYYVDKTLLIRDFLDKRPFVSLFTRPRRFGKTLNMDMLRVFFEISDGEDTSRYFKNKKIWHCGDRYTKHQGKYPVIFLTFKDVKYDSWEYTRDKMAALLRAEYNRHLILKESIAIADYERQYFLKILEGTASELELSMALENLSKMLHEHYGIAPVIIIDEYDTPIEQGYSKDYYEKIIGFMRTFFSGAFKDNAHLSFGFMTGILKIAQESIFSGLNNLKVNSILDEDYSEYFGFTTNEVKALATYYDVSDKYEELLEWYDGYRFGSREIFNPWSVINYVDGGCVPGAYWVSTGNNEILDDILKNATSDIMEKMNKLLQGENVIASINTNVVYPGLGNDPAYVYSFLLVAGYLKAVPKGMSGTGNYMCELSIPNKEIGVVYRTEILTHLKQAGMISQSTASAIEEALFAQDSEMLEKAFTMYLDKTISYYDAGTEGFYHGLLAGILAIMDNQYRITSNRESGDGRYDMALKPVLSNLPGILIEIKYSKESDEEKLEQLSKEALKQIEDKRYDSEMRNDGIEKIIKYGVAFSGKKVKIVKG